MLEQLKPVDVFQYFEEICSIPHGSGNIGTISNYLVDFAKKNGLEYKQDDMGNVIIIKEATPGMEDAMPVIIQGHMDMVAVKDADCDKDLEKEGLTLAVDGDFIYAKGTSLGGDDGIAVAYALALLAGKEYVHPRLEVVITVDEEIGLFGAAGIDLSGLKSKTLLNIDSEKEGELTVACAGGLSIHADWDIAWTENDAPIYELSLSGITGGHSGTEIGRRGANANQILMQTIYLLSRECDIALVSANGGTKDNVIPSSAKALITCASDEKHITGMVSIMAESLKQDWADTDSDLELKIVKIEKDMEQTKVVDAANFMSLMDCFTKMPNGVQKMSPQLEGLVQTSLNFGILDLVNDGKLTATFSLRSSVSEEKEDLAQTVEAILKESGANSKRDGEYPAWEYKEDSVIRDKMVSIYKKMFKKDPIVLSIHAGLECGILSQKIDDLDCISFGPDIHDIHTTSEKLSISSTLRTWEFIKEVLKTK